MSAGIDNQAKNEEAKYGLAPRSRRSVRPILFVAFHVAIAALLLSPIWMGQRTFFGCCDASMQSIAWLTKVADAARAGHLSLWDFSTFSGSTFAGELQPAPFYPITIALSLTGWRELMLANAYMAVHIFISLVGMNFFLKTNGLRLLSRVIGSILFTYCGFVYKQAPAQVNIYAGLVMLPLIAAFFQRSLSSRTRLSCLLNLILASLFSTAQIYAGHLTPYIYSVYGMMLLCLVSFIGDWRRFYKVAAIFAAFAVLSVTLAAVPLTLSFEYLKVAYRWFQGGISTFPHEVTLKSWREASPLVSADWGTLIDGTRSFSAYESTFYFTIVGLCLLPALFLVRSRLMAWCITLVAFSVFIEVSSASSITAAITHALPLLAQTRIPARSFLLYAFAVSSLVAVALDAIENRVSQIDGRLASGMTVAILAICVAELYLQAPAIGMPTTDRQEAQRYYNADPPVEDLVRLSGGGPLVDRFITYPINLVPPNVGETRPVLNVFGHRGTMYIPFFDFVQRDWDFAHSKSFDELGARWFVSDKPRDDMKLLDQGPGFYLYERPVALSVFWTDDGHAKQRAAVTSVDWSANYVQIKLDPASQVQHLVFAQASYPGWSVRVGGKRASLKTDDIFMAVDVPPGATDVRFSYDPNLAVPIAVSLAALFCVFLGCVLAAHRDRRWGPSSFIDVPAPISR